MKDGWLTTTAMRRIDDSGLTVAAAFVGRRKGEEVSFEQH